MSNDEPRRSRLRRLMETLMGNEITMRDRVVTNYLVQAGGFASRAMQGPSPTGRTATQVMEEQRLRERRDPLVNLTVANPSRLLLEDADFRILEERVLAHMLAAPPVLAQQIADFSALSDASQTSALDAESFALVLQQAMGDGHPLARRGKIEPKPHPDTGKQVKPARIQRSLLGSEVTDVRLKSGRIERKASLKTTVEIKFKRRNQPKTGQK